MDDPLPILELGVIAVGLAASFLLSLSEAALLAVNPLRLRQRAESGDARAPIVQALTRANRDYLSAIIAGNTLVLILVANTTTRLVMRVAEQPEHWIALASGLMLAFIVIFCELTPKSFGKRYPTRTALRVARLVQALTTAMRPVVRGLTAIGGGVLRLFGLKVREARRFLTQEDIRAAAEVGEEEGALEPMEREMIDKVIELGATPAHEIMTPRVDIEAVDEEATPEDVLTLAEDKGLSRIPVYRETIDDIIGIVYVNDLLAQLSQGNGDVRVRDIVREPIRVPGTKKIDELFAELQRKQVHMAVVLDEYGGTEGLVTIEDILEEIVGEIRDEHDQETPEIQPLSPTEALVDAGADVDDVGEALGVDIPEGDYHTIGGFVFAQAGKVPEVGERIVVDDFELIVEACDGQRIESVRVIRPAGAGAGLGREE
ncbi:MAG: hemolysin family protein [Armatimonadota bacterium]